MVNLVDVEDEHPSVAIEESPVLEKTNPNATYSDTMAKRIGTKRETSVPEVPSHEVESSIEDSFILNISRDRSIQSKWQPSQRDSVRNFT